LSLHDTLIVDPEQARDWRVYGTDRESAALTGSWEVVADSKRVRA
jgi:hypothetical protein